MGLFKKHVDHVDVEAELIKRHHDLMVRVAVAEKEIAMWKERSDQLSGAYDLKSREASDLQNLFLRVITSEQNLEHFKMGVDLAIKT